MRAAQFCFVLAGASAISAAGLALAQTYQDSYCFGSPMSPCFTQCGCPITGEPNDFCSGDAPPKGQISITYYSCAAGLGTTCTAPGTAHPCIDPGAGSIVVNCSCWTCGGSGGGRDCPAQPACIVTSKDKACGDQGYGIAYFGCTDS